MPKIISITPDQHAHIIRLRTQEPPLPLHAIAARVDLSVSTVQRILASVPELAAVSLAMQRLGGRPGHWQDKMKAASAAPVRVLPSPDVALAKAALALDAARVACQADIEVGRADEVITRIVKHSLTTAIKAAKDALASAKADGTSVQRTVARNAVLRAQDTILKHRQPRRCRTCRAMLNVWPCLLCSNRKRRWSKPAKICSVHEIHDQ